MPPAMRLAALLGAALILVGAGGCRPLNDARVKAYLMDRPELLQEIAYEIADAEHRKTLAEAEAKIPQYREALERDPRDFVANPAGRITVVEFFDYNCGYCKQAMPELMALIESDPDIRFVFKEMPILRQESRVAAAAALAAKESGDYLLVHQKLYAAPALTGPEITRIMREEGLDPAVVAERASSPEIARHLSDVHQLAADLGISNATPSFVIGNRIVQGADMPAIRAAITEARRKT